MALSLFGKGMFRSRFGAGVSAEAQSVLDRMTSLTTTEENAIIGLVDSEVLDGNWDKYDDFIGFSLISGDASNGLKGFKNVTATNSGAVLDINGANFTGTEYIDTNFNLVSNAINYSQNNALIGIFIKSIQTPFANTSIYGNSIGIDTNCYMRQNYSNARIHLSLNSARANGAGGYASSGMEVVSRESSSSAKEYRDGILNDTIATTSTSVASTTVILGDTVIDTPLIGIISTFIIGASVGFDHVAHNINVRAFLTALGTIP